MHFVDDDDDDVGLPIISQNHGLILQSNDK
jgi:hypothetical protein